MTSYPISIITPNGKIFDGQVESLIAPGVEGFFEVLNNHAPMVAMLKEGVLVLTQGSNRLFFAIGPGVLEVNQKHSTLLLVDFALPAVSANEAREKLQSDNNSLLAKAK